MKQNFVFANLRPPVAISHNGTTPLRTRSATRTFQLGNGKYKDKNGYYIGKDVIVKNQTDDGRLTDVTWDSRHHVIPSLHNTQNHHYYRAYFQKPFRQHDARLLTPEKRLDPYEENEVKGTRMPDYSVVALERDLNGELGWVPNFEVTKSKNNMHRHLTYKEMFDAPKDYDSEFHQASMTNTEFYKTHVPSTDSKGSGDLQFSHKRSLNATARRVFSSMRPQKQRSRHTLKPSLSAAHNRHKVSNILHQTVGIDNSIPFLRDNRDVSNQKFCEVANTEDVQQIFKVQKGKLQTLSRSAQKSLKQLKRKEHGWCNYVQPISKYNERVHNSRRIPFEKI